MKEIIKNLSELQADQTIPKNIKLRVQDVIDVLEGKPELSIRVNKAFNILEEIADDSNLQSYIRTQIWNIVSMLEKV